MRSHVLLNFDFQIDDFGGCLFQGIVSGEERVVVSQGSLRCFPADARHLQSAFQFN
jgi:hypothetical protein